MQQKIRPVIKRSSIPAVQQAVQGAASVRSVPLAELDRELAVAADLFGKSEDSARAHLAQIQLEYPADHPSDPLSPEFSKWTWDLYLQISGRSQYTTENEASPIDVDAAVHRPFPYQTGSPTVVGGDLIARGQVLQCLGSPAVGFLPPAKVVEFGPGWGNLTGDLVATGFDVFAVEVDDRFCELLTRRFANEPGLSVVQTDMLSFSTEKSVDAAIFFESFHHCAEHLKMLEMLHDIVKPGGLLVFAAEPVHDMSYAWGPRLDGLSLWSMRTYGWLELGFDRNYFVSALARTGWELVDHGVPNANVLIAKDAASGSRPGTRPAAVATTD